MANENQTTKVVTGKVRFSYLQVFQPAAMEEGQEKKYSVSLLIPKTDTVTIAKINAAIEAAREEAKAKNGGKLPARFELPLRDGDVERPEDDAYAGHFFISAKSKTKPGLVDKDMNEIIDPEELYSGCYGRASINFYPFDKAGNRGVACGLNNLQKLKDGEPLSGRTSAAVDFADGFEDEDDDLM